MTCISRCEGGQGAVLPGTATGGRVGDRAVTTSGHHQPHARAINAFQPMRAAIATSLVPVDSKRRELSFPGATAPPRSHLDCQSEGTAIEVRFSDATNRESLVLRSPRVAGGDRWDF